MSLRVTADGQERYCPACERSFSTGDVCPQDGTTLVLLSTGPDRLLGTTLDGRYTIVEKLGAGGMGTVYLGVQLSVEREVAIKVVSPNLMAHSEVIKRFLREAKLASRLNHPNAVAVLDFGRGAGDLFFLVMERLAGQTLEHLIAGGGRLPVDRALAIARQICDALVGAHQLSIVHRDLKPSNIMIVAGAGGREVVKVLDFGLAKLVSSEVSAQVTRTGVVIGTPAYMSPELATGRDADERVDLYALGCILYEMLSGVVPFAGKTLHETLAMHASHPPSPLADVPPWLEAVVYRLMEKSPADRFASAAATLEALSGPAPAGDESGVRAAHALSPSQVVSRPALPVEISPTLLGTPATPAPAPALAATPGQSSRRGRRIALSLAVLVLAASAVVGWRLRRGEPVDEPSAAPPRAAAPSPTAPALAPATPPAHPAPVGSLPPPDASPPAAVDSEEAGAAGATRPRRIRRHTSKRDHTPPDQGSASKGSGDGRKKGLPF